MSNKYGLVLVVLLLVALTACGPSEKEVALSDEVAQLTETKQGLESKRAEKLVNLEEKQAELGAIKATPAGALCVARLVLDIDGVEQASDAELQKGEELYGILIERYPDSEYVKEAKRVLRKIEDIWKYKGKPVSASDFTKNREAYAGQTIVIPGKLDANSYSIEFRFDGSGRGVSWYMGDPTLPSFDNTVILTNLARRGTSGEIVLKVNNDGSFRVQRIFAGGETIEF